MVLPPIETKDAEGTVFQPATQVVRTPLIAGFKTGLDQNYPRHRSHHLRRRQSRIQPTGGRDQADEYLDPYEGANSETFPSNGPETSSCSAISIYSPPDQTMKMITDAGFVVPPMELKTAPFPSNISNEYYDQIAFPVRPGQVPAMTGKAGVLIIIKRSLMPEDGSDLSSPKWAPPF